MINHAQFLGGEAEVASVIKIMAAFWGKFSEIGRGKYVFFRMLNPHFCGIVLTLGLSCCVALRVEIQVKHSELLSS